MDDPGAWTPVRSVGSSGLPLGQLAVNRVWLVASGAINQVAFHLWLAGG